MNKEKLLITTAIDYANAVIHIGHAYEKLLADFFARHERILRGDEAVYFVTGTDEHGNSTYKKAQELGLTTREHVDQVAAGNKKEIDSFKASYQRFIRTTDEDHKKVASDFFQRAYDAGDIYKKEYIGLYCEGCEDYKTLSQLEDGKCPNHKSRTILELKEENYFFKLSEYRDFLKDLILHNKLLILPEGKRNEMLAFIDDLDDIPVSRPKSKLPWGIEIPFDKEQVIYVWFDALTNYYTAGKEVGFWDQDTKIVHFVGKDINRFHSLLWPAMLKSVSEKLPDVIYVHGFINLNGQKISKSLGNVIAPTELVQKYGVDAFRYYFLKHGPIVEDVDVSIPQFEEVYNADLANGLGNTAARLAKLAENSGLEFEFLQPKYELQVTDYRADLALVDIWTKLGVIDRHINEHTPWKIDDKETLQKVLSEEINLLREFIAQIEPIIPDTYHKLTDQFFTKNIKAREPLFPRL